MSVNDATGMWVDDGLSTLKAARARKEALEDELRDLMRSGGGGRRRDATDYGRMLEMAGRGAEIRRRRNEIVGLLGLARRRSGAAARRMKRGAERIEGAVGLLRLLAEKSAAHLDDPDIARDYRALRRASDELVEAYARLRGEMPGLAPETGAVSEPSEARPQHQNI